MPERPNLDYEPGPSDASYSRLGPPERLEAVPGLEAAAAVQHLAIDLADDVEGQQEASRRPSRRRYGYR